MARRRKTPRPPLWTFAQAVRQLFHDWKRQRRSFTPGLRRCRFLLEELEDRTAPSATPFGSEFLVNTYTQGPQQTFYPGPPSPAVVSQSVAMDSSTGDYVVTWASQNQIPGAGWDIFAQRYNAAGTPLGGNVVVNTTTSHDQEDPSVAMSANGSFVITWQGNQNGQWGVYAQLYNAAGVAQGSEFQVSSSPTTDQVNPVVAMDASGDFIIAWSSQNTGGGGWDVDIQRYNAAGVAQGSPIVYGTTPSATDVAVAMDAAGDFVVAAGVDGSGAVNGTEYAQLYNAAGVAQGSLIQVGTTTTNKGSVPAVAMDANGDFVVAWDSNDHGGDIDAQRFNAAGVAQGSTFVVNTYTNGHMQFPQVAMSPSGSFVVTWSSQGQTGPGNSWDVYAQQYDASGTALGSNYLVNTFTNGNQQYSSAAMDDQHVVLVWSSNNQDGNNWGVYGQQYDLSGITITPANTSTTPLSTTSLGGTATFSVVLNSQPTANVVIDLSSSNILDGTVSTSQLTFTPSDWNQAQAVTITGAALPGTYTINFTAAQSSDSSYNGLVAPSVYVSNSLLASAGVTVTPLTQQVTSESGGQAQFSVVLTSAPIGTVTIPISSSDTSVAVVDQSLLTFNALNWNTPQIVTVTGVDDYVATSDTPYTVTIGAAQDVSDPSYNGQFASSLSFTNLETDRAGVTVTQLTPMTTTESGGQAKFSVVLTSAPVGTVTIPISSSDTTAGTVSTSQLTFDSTDWNVAQTVTVTGVDDYVVTGNRTYTVNIGAAQDSSDPNYDGQFASSLTLTNQETDTAGVTVTQLTPMTTTESGGQAKFSVVLTSKPAGTDTVTIPISSSDTTAGTVNYAQLVFDTTNWSTPQTVTVTGVDDQVFTADRTYSIVFAPASSTDPTYSGWQLASLQVVNQETDTPPSPPSTPSTPAAPQSGATSGSSSLPLAPGSSTPSASIAAAVTSSSFTETGGASAVGQALLSQLTTSSPSASSVGSSGVPVVLVSTSTTTNSGAMTLTSLISGSQALSSAPSGGGGGAAALDSSPETSSPKGEESATAAAVNASQSPPREAVAKAPTPAVSTPAVQLSTGGLQSSTTGLLPPTKAVVPLPVKLDFLRSQLDGGAGEVERAARVEKTTRLVFTTGTVVSVGYVIFSSRGGSWLLSAVAARPLWKQLDPLEVLFAWEAEKKRLGLDGEEETLQSLVE